MNLKIVDLLQVAFIIIISCSTVSAVETVLLKEGQYPLGLFLEYYQDTERNLTINDIISQKFNDKFEKSQTEVLNFGYDTAKMNIWLRFKLKNSFDQKTRFILEIAMPQVDVIEFYEPNQRQDYICKKGGESVSTKNFNLKYPSPTFDIVLNPWEEKIYYIKYHDEGTVHFPVIVWSENAFIENAVQTQIAKAIYFGIILSMFLYNLFLFYTVKDKGYLFYILYLSSVGGFQLLYDGWAKAYLLHDLNFWWLNRIFIIFGLFLVFWLLQFSQTFLNTKKFAPRLNKLKNVLKCLLILGMFLLFILKFSTVGPFIVVLVMLGLLVVLISSVYCYKQGNDTAKFFIFAFIAVISSALLFLLKTLQFLPSNFITEHSFQIGSAIEVVILSFGLGDRINREKNKKINAQKREAKALDAVLKQKEREETLIRSIAGGVAHEERNALTGPKYQIDHINSYNEGKSVYDLYLKGMQALMDNIKELESKYNISKQEMGQKIVSRLKDQSKLLDVLKSKNEIIAKGLERGLDISTRFKEFAENQNVPRGEDEIDVYDLLNSYKTLFEYRIQKKGILYALDCPLGAKIKGAIAQIDTILKNIILNAFDAVMETREKKVSVTVLDQNDILKIYITDSGIGILHEKSETIFDPFESTKPNTGYGLGLTEVQNMVKKYDGNIEVRSKPGETVFLVELKK